jgi:hypothetical protein
MRQTRHGAKAWLFLAFLVGATAGLATTVPAASAAVYEVHVCASATPPLNFISDRPKHLVQENLCASDESIHQGAIVETSPPLPLSELNVDGTFAWGVTAPPGTTIVGLQVFRVYTGRWFAESTRWELRTTPTLGGPGTVLESRQSNPDPQADFTNPPSAQENFDIASMLGQGAPSVYSIFGCPRPPGGNEPCPAFRNHGVALLGPVVRLEDPIPPTVPVLSGSLLDPGLVGGTRELAFSAGDSGSGVAGATLSIDGVQRQSIDARNGGACVQPYKALVPCPPNLASSFSLDTPTVGPGEHTATVTVRDGAGQTSSSSATFTVMAPPRNTAAPMLTGAAVVGGQLSATTGSWNGNPSGFEFTWLRCPPSVTSAAESSRCVRIPGTIGTDAYAVTAADVGFRVMVTVTAVNPGGRTSASSLPSGIVGSSAKDSTAPVLSRVSFASRRKLLRFTCSEAARLSVTLKRRGAAKPLLAIERPISSGRGKLPLAGRLRKRQLRPGAYRLVLTARDAAGNVSRPVRLRARVRLR